MKVFAFRLINKIDMRRYLRRVISTSLALCVTIALSIPTRAGEMTGGIAAIQVSGRVKVDGHPRKGVIVSDGITVTATDANGCYNIRSAGPQYVFISVPADCAIPMSGGMPAFYNEIKGIDGMATCDFDLKSAPVARRWKLVAIADPQIAPCDTSEYARVLMPQLKRLIDTIGPDTYGFALGDLVWNSPKLYPKYIEETSRLGIPVFSVIGNHDHNEKVHNDTGSDRDFRNHLGPTYYSVNIGSCHLVALDDVLYRGKKHRNDYSGRLTEAQLQWLEKDLAHVPDSMTVIVGLHIPTSRRNAPWTLDNCDELYDLLKRFHRAEILTGHTHYQITTSIAPNITETTFGAAMGAFWYPICADGSPRGFGVLEFDGPELVDKYYIGAGMPRNRQMNLYAPADAVLWNPDVAADTPYDKILINIFCWHTDWTVEVSEDDMPFATLPAGARLIPGVSAPQCVDPLVRKSLVDGRLPAHHGGSKACDINDHMFLYTPSTDWRKVTVRATDPYGNAYTDSLFRADR